MRSKGYSIKQISKELKLSITYVAKIIEDLARGGYCKPLELKTEPVLILNK